MARAPVVSAGVTPQESVVSIRVPRELLDRVDELRTQLRPVPAKSTVLVWLMKVGLEQGDAESFAPVRPVPRPSRPPLAWEPRVRALHADGRTNAQIAEEMGVSAGTVRQWLHKLRLIANR